MSKFGDAAFSWMRANRLSTVTSSELWAGLEATLPELTSKSATRKTPRSTCMRDLRKDSRFKVGKGVISLV